MRRGFDGRRVRYVAWLLRPALAWCCGGEAASGGESLRCDQASVASGDCEAYDGLPRRRRAASRCDIAIDGLPLRRRAAGRCDSPKAKARFHCVAFIGCPFVAGRVPLRQPFAWLVTALRIR